MRKYQSEANRATFIINFFVIMISLFGIYRQTLKVDQLTFFETLIVEVTGPLQSGTKNVKDSITSFFSHYLYLVNTSKNNVELKKEVSELEGKLFFLSELEKENKRLKDLLDFAENIPRKKVLAQIVGWDSSGSFRVLRVNKGSVDGIKTLFPVVTAKGLVGYTYRVSRNYSDVLTILDPNNRVDSIVSRSRSHGVLEGNNNYTCNLKYVVRSEDVRVGDKVLTAGLGNIYPKGIKLGTIQEIDKEDAGITQRIQVKPAVDFNRLEEVLVLVKTDDNDLIDPTTEEIEESLDEI